MPALSSGVAVEAEHTCPHPGRNQTYCAAGVGAWATCYGSSTAARARR